MRSPASARSIAKLGSTGRTAGRRSSAGKSFDGKSSLGKPAGEQAAAGRAAAGATSDAAAGELRLRLLLGKAVRKLGQGRAAPPTPKGIAFSIGDLLMVQAWAEAQNIAMQIYLDHGSRSEEYEEAIAIQPTSGPIGRALIWRNEASVFVQPLLGRRRRYGSVSAALERLTPEERVSVTDIVAKSWPKD